MVHVHNSQHHTYTKHPLPPPKKALLLAFLAILGASLQHITTTTNTTGATHYFQAAALWPSDAAKLPLAFGNLVAAFEGMGVGGYMKGRRQSFSGEGHTRISTHKPTPPTPPKGIGTVLPVEHSMAQAGVRAAYPQLLRAALLLIAALFVLFGIVGYGAFGPGLCSVILTSLPAGAAAGAARVAMVVGLFFTCAFLVLGGWM